MIYQFKVTLKGMKPPVWRRLQLDGRMTFGLLHEVLQLAFDWDGIHPHSTTMLRKGGQKVRAEIREQEEVPRFPSQAGPFDEESETLAKWFWEEKDRALYTYNSCEKWEHEIVLEKILPPEDNVQYPRCVKAMRDVCLEHKPDGEPDTGWRERTADVNRKLADGDFEYLLRLNDSSFNWPQLIAEAQALNDAAPWQDLYDDQVFAVFDPSGEQYLYCCVLGAAGQEYGLGVYIGNDGLEALKDTLSENLGEDFLMKQRSLLLAFSDREELDDEDLAFLDKYGAAPTGRKQYVQLRSMVPGFLPWSLDDEEGRLLLIAIRQTQAILEQVRSGLVIPPYEGGDEMVVRLPKQQGQTTAWDTAIARFKEPKPAAPAELHISEFDIKRIQRLKTIPKTIQYGLFMLPAPIQEVPGERAFFPLMAVAIDSRDNTVIHQDLTRADKQDTDVQYIFAETLFQLQALPATVELTQQMAAALEPVTSQLPIQVHIRPELEGVETFREFIQNMPFN